MRSMLQLESGMRESAHGARLGPLSLLASWHLP